MRHEWPRPFAMGVCGCTGWGSDRVCERGVCVCGKAAHDAVCPERTRDGT